VAISSPSGLEPGSLIGQPWSAVDTPALLVDLDRMAANISRMAALARSRGLDLRPHFKTHKSVEIARRQVAAGAIGMTVAKLDEAEALVDGGIRDVFVAYEIVGQPKLSRAMALAARARITFAIDGVVGTRALSAAAVAAGLRVPVTIEIDCGLRRCGVLPVDAAALATVAATLPGIKLDGVFTHAGNVYSAANRAQVEQIARDEAASVRDAAAAIRAAGIPLRVASVGSTPTAELVAAEPGMTELRPGNYVFYDAMQVALGTIGPESCALTIAATVVSRAAPDRAVIDAGSKTLGLDKGAHGTSLLTDYGRLLDDGRPGDASATIQRVSEEHGILAIPADSTMAPGDRVRLLPNHACTIGNLGRFYVGIRDGHVAENLTIDAAGGVQ
jgi:D-serine deaminase-like pyridoxal phosphate-dependent protein